MKLIRAGVFETNSSSTNSLWIGDGSKLNVPDKLYIVDFVWCGRDFDYKTADERFTALVTVCSSIDEFLALCYKVYSFGVKEIVLPNKDTFGNISNFSNFYLSCGEIDDSREELQCLLLDENTNDLMNYLFDEESELSGEDDNF